MAEIEIDGEKYRLLVDHDLCMGTRVCVARLPDVFTVDDEDNLSSASDDVLDPALIDAVRETIDDCPQGAIRLEKLN
jgi:ferredoxin